MSAAPRDSVGSGKVSKDTSAAVAARFGVIAASSSTAMEVRARFLLLGGQEDIYVTGKNRCRCQERGAPAWRFRRRLWMAGRVRVAEERRLHRVNHPESDDLVADDVAVTKRMLAAQYGPAILVGH